MERTQEILESHTAWVTAHGETDMQQTVIEKMLVISTGHLPKEVMDDTLAQIDNRIYIGMTREEGCLLHIPSTEIEKYSPDLYYIMEFAQHQQCEWVLFDRDGPTYNNLPTFDW